MNCHHCKHYSMYGTCRLWGGNIKARFKEFGKVQWNYQEDYCSKLIESNAYDIMNQIDEII